MVIRKNKRQLVPLGTVDAVLDRGYGGAAKAQRALKRGPQAISNWRARGNFPPTLFHKMTGDLRRRGFCAPPALWSQETAAAEAA